MSQQNGHSVLSHQPAQEEHAFVGQEQEPSLMQEATLAYLNGENLQPGQRFRLLRAFDSQLSETEAVRRVTTLAEGKQRLPIEKLHTIIQAWVMMGENKFVSAYRTIRPERLKGVVGGGRSIEAIDSVLI